MIKKSSKIDAVRKAILDLGLDFPELNFIQRNSLYSRGEVSIHEVDTTPKLANPDIPDGGRLNERCYDHQHGIDVGGKAATSSEGKFTWKLSNFICENGRLFVSEPASFVATARSKTPVFLTSNTISAGNDLIIDVFSWDSSGKPSPNAHFSWRCWVDTPIVVD